MSSIWTLSMSKGGSLHINPGWNQTSLAHNFFCPISTFAMELLTVWMLMMKIRDSARQVTIRKTLQALGSFFFGFDHWLLINFICTLWKNQYTQYVYNTHNHLYLPSPSSACWGNDQLSEVITALTWTRLSWAAFWRAGKELFAGGLKFLKLYPKYQETSPASLSQ